MSDPQNRDETGQRDASTGRFVTGNRANPGGRRAMSDEDRAALEELVPAAWARLKQLVASESDKVAMVAVREVFDRRYGRSPMAAEDNDAAAAVFAEMVSRLRQSEPPK